ncbi:hypothetical protein AB6A40_003710 [Gnathostoma spinigerum]|uniref:Aminotransferase class I/classII large domain-containing protein n=1 Tax=Gnathostoma spinigerum TaxID=75299 RepID=A0ABD6EBH6_9BILA
MLRHPGRRVANMKPSVWTEFNQLAADCKAVNVGQGFPDIPIPPFVAEINKNIAANPQRTDWYQYTRGFGHPRLVKALGNLYTDLLHREVSSDSNILITVGAYAALYYSFLGWLSEGDEVIILEPAYDSYVTQIRMADAIPVPVLLQLSNRPKSSNDYKVNVEAIESKITKKTKMIVVNNPHNPTGKLFTREELMALADLANRHDLIVVADEVYEWHVHPGHEMIRFASLPGMYERTITIGSAGKCFSVTGWKTGWAIGSANLLEPLRALHQNVVFTCPTTIQEAIAQAFEVEIELMRRDPQKSYLKTLLAKELSGKCKFMTSLLENAGLKPVVPQSGYFMLADFSEFDITPYLRKDEAEDPMDYQFVRWLCRSKNLAVIPPSAFYSEQFRKDNDRMIRICFFKNDDTLARTKEILQNFKTNGKK